MGISLIQTLGTTGNALTALPAALRLASTQGNLLIAHCEVSPADSVAPTVSAPAGWSLAASSTPSAKINVYLFYYANCPAGITSASFDFGGTSCEAAVILEEWAGLDASANPLDQTATNSSTTATITTGATPSTTAASELAVWCLGYNNATPLTDSSVLNGYAESLISPTFSIGAPQANLHAFNQVISSAGAQSSGTTLSAIPSGGSHHTGVCLATFRAAGVAPVQSAAVSLVQSNGTGNNAPSSSLLAPLANPTQAGNLVLAAIEQGNNSALTLPAGWTQVAQVTPNAARQVTLAYLQDASGGNTSWTFTQGTSGPLAVLLSEWAGIQQTGSPVDATSSGFDSANAAVTIPPTATTAQAVELWYVVLGINQGAPPSLSGATAGYSADVQTADTVNQTPNAHLLEWFQVTSVTGAAAFAGTWANPSSNWQGIIATFLAAPAPTGGTGGGTIGVASGSIG